MKKTTKDYTLLAIAIPVLIAIMASYPGCYSNTSAKPVTHQCIDKTHLECDGGCECDGMECKLPVNECPYEGQECPNYNTCTGHGVAARDYQI